MLMIASLSRAMLPRQLFAVRLDWFNTVTVLRLLIVLEMRNILLRMLALAVCLAKQRYFLQ